MFYIAASAWLTTLPPFPYLTAWLESAGAVVPYLALALTLAALIWVLDRWLRLLHRYWLWKRDVYAITNFRLIHQHGLLSTEFREIPLLQVRDVDVEQGWWMRRFGYGWVFINSLQTAAPEVVKRKGYHHPSKRDPNDPPGLERWLPVPRPYEIEREIESQTEALLASRQGVAPLGQSR